MDTASSPPPSSSQHAAAASSLINPVPLSIPSILVEPRTRNANPPRSQLVQQIKSHTASSGRSRVISHRKWLRQENARFANNPHVVRPKPSDYQPGTTVNERYRSTWWADAPQKPSDRELMLAGLNAKGQDGPRDHVQVREWHLELAEWKRLDKERRLQEQRRKEMKRGDLAQDPQTTTNGSATSPATPQESGLFTMSLPEARFFLKRRAGVKSKLDKEELASTSPTSPMQTLTDRIEDHFSHWKDQVVYLSQASEGTDTTKLDHDPTVIVSSSSASPTSSATSLGRCLEYHHLPQSLSLLIPDSFDRLAVHCLARVWGFRSFSKTACQGERDVKLTWILKPPRKTKRVDRFRVDSAQSVDEGTSPSSSDRPRQFLNPLLRHLTKGTASPVRRGPATTSNVGRIRIGVSGFETPPTTDVGSEIDSHDEASSAVSSDAELGAEEDQLEEDPLDTTLRDLDLGDETFEADSEAGDEDRSAATLASSKANGNPNRRRKSAGIAAAVSGLQAQTIYSESEGEGDVDSDEVPSSASSANGDV